MNLDAATSEILEQLRVDGYLDQTHLKDMSHLTKFYEDVMGFLHAIQWADDRWIKAWFVVFGMLFVATLYTRKRPNLQILLFLINCSLVYASETLNVLGSIYWRNFSTQNYFDDSGVFIGVVYATPLIILIIIQIVLTLYDSAHLLVVVKVTKPHF